MKNAATTSHTTVLPKPPVASAIVSVPESTANATATKARAPMGIGRRTIPTIVATNTARSRNARGSTPSGAGTNQIRPPARITAPRLAAFARAVGAVCRDASSAMPDRNRRAARVYRIAPAPTPADPAGARRVGPAG